jgi:hypothetical protein
MEKYYFCTTKTYFKTEQVLGSIIEIFEEKGLVEMKFHDIYNALRDKLFVTSVNHKNLQQLLNATDIVALDDVKSLYKQSALLDQDDEMDDAPFEEDYVISKHNVVKKAEVFKHLKTIFLEQQVEQMKLTDIKNELAKKLNCTHVNMDSLKKLLKPTKPYVMSEEIDVLAKEFDQRLQQKTEEIEIKKIAKEREAKKNG